MYANIFTRLHTYQRILLLTIIWKPKYILPAYLRMYSAIPQYTNPPFSMQSLSINDTPTAWMILVEWWMLYYFCCTHSVPSKCPSKHKTDLVSIWVTKIYRWPFRLFKSFLIARWTTFLKRMEDIYYCQWFQLAYQKAFSSKHVNQFIGILQLISIFPITHRDRLSQRRGYGRMTM